MARFNDQPNSGCAILAKWNRRVRPAHRSRRGGTPLIKPWISSSTGGLSSTSLTRRSNGVSLRLHAGSYAQRRYRRWLSTAGVLGDRDEKLSGTELEIAVCRACGDLGCGNLAVDVERTAEAVVWRQPHWSGTVDDDDEDDEPDANDPESLFPQVLVFSRAEYDAALADTEWFIAQLGWSRALPEAAGWLDRLRNRFTGLKDK